MKHLHSRVPQGDLPKLDPAIKCWNGYATDGRCHNSEDGERECHAPAVWLGERDTEAGPWRCGYCDHCKREGREAKHMTRWFPFERAPIDPPLPEPEPDQGDDPMIHTATGPAPAVHWWSRVLECLNEASE